MQAFLLLVTNDYFGLIVIEFGQCTTECGQLLLNLARFIATFGLVMVEFVMIVVILVVV